MFGSYDSYLVCSSTEYYRGYRISKVFDKFAFKILWGVFPDDLDLCPENMIFLSNLKACCKDEVDKIRSRKNEG